jgi:asparagine synthase (glutamine-hydrolysing)
MSGFCGWMGGGYVGDSTALLERMANSLPNYGPIQALATCGPGFGIALRSHPATGAFAIDYDMIAAVEGYPRWSDPTLVKIAADRGHARALLAAYRRRGPALFEFLRGAFSFAIVDLSTRRLLCAIDRFGVQTLCYARPRSDVVVFGSTTDAVRAHPHVGATVVPQSIFDYLYFVDRVPAPATIYREQRKLAPAEYLIAEAGHTKIESYWHMPYRSSARIEKSAAAEELKTRLRDAVKMDLESEDSGKIGAFLSGGLDSSSVVGLAAELLSQRLKTFTIGFDVEGFDETKYAEITARHFETKHKTYYVAPSDVVDVLGRAARIYDEPFANSSIVPAYCCARLARNAGVEVMLAGDGGDELFAGNKRYLDDRIFAYYDRLPTVLKRRIVDPLINSVSFARSMGQIGKVVRYVDFARRSVPDRMTDNLFRRRQPAEIFEKGMLDEIDMTAPLSMAAAIYDAPEDATKVQRMMHLDLRLTLADSDLRKVCRMCELAEVRTRFPFLNEELAEFSAGLPENVLLEEGRLREFYKQAMRGFLPRAVIHKRKHGFGLPYLTLMNSHKPLGDLVCDSLNGLKTRGYFRNDFINDLIDRARRGCLSTYDTAAWDLVGLELWFEARENSR